ncbi:MAG: TIM barrel protein [Desulfovibrio sp.]|jgi:hydroxypyruvate isomerase|nr:TIM barrel protein [Desulfovibrio sp.]
MFSFAANISMLFTELPFPERFCAAREAGFRYIEVQFPYAYPPEEVAELLKDNGLSLVLFNLPAGDWAAGERGLGADPARVEEFRAGLEQAVRYAKILHTPLLNCLAGKINPKFDAAEHRRTLLGNLGYAADFLLPHKLCLTVENVNGFDVPGFFLQRTDMILEAINEINRPNVRLQYDIYHAQRSEGEIVNTLRNNLEWIGHIQVADNPGRGWPGSGEINYRFVFAELEKVGYQGHIGLEYMPGPKAGDTAASLKNFDWRS